jgi:hypothetical protein
MSHPNVDLASEIVKCTRAVDLDSVEVLAVSGKRKGFLLLDSKTNRYVLTAKGQEFVAKWRKKETVPVSVAKQPALVVNK